MIFGFEPTFRGAHKALCALAPARSLALLFRRALALFAEEAGICFAFCLFKKR